MFSDNGASRGTMGRDGTLVFEVGVNSSDVNCYSHSWVESPWVIDLPSKG